MWHFKVIYKSWKKEKKKKTEVIPTLNSLGKECSLNKYKTFITLVVHGKIWKEQKAISKLPPLMDMVWRCVRGKCS